MNFVNVFLIIILSLPELLFSLRGDFLQILNKQLFLFIDKTT